MLLRSVQSQWLQHTHITLSLREPASYAVEQLELVHLRPLEGASGPYCRVCSAR
jgi:hypothetical protein